MPNNRRITKKAIKGKEHVHPGSRKAGQLARVALRTTKLRKQVKEQKATTSSKLYRPLFFLHSLDSPHPLSLSSLRALISDVYLTRHDERIKELTAERRPGRPKAKELLELEEIRRIECAEWETGIEVPDLTHPPTVKLLYTLIDSDTAFHHSHLDLIRLIRLFKDDPEQVVISKEGKTQRMGLITADEDKQAGEDWASGVEQPAGMEVEGTA